MKRSKSCPDPQKAGKAKMILVRGGAYASNFGFVYLCLCMSINIYSTRVLNTCNQAALSVFCAIRLFIPKTIAMHIRMYIQTYIYSHTIMFVFVYT